LREVEYAVDWPDGGGPAGPRLLVRGLIDCLWQDGAGGWHVLSFDAGRPSDADWRRRLPGLVGASLAVRAQFDVWPKTAGRYYADGAVTVSPGRRPPPPGPGPGPGPPDPAPRPGRP